MPQGVAGGAGVDYRCAVECIVYVEDPTLDPDDLYTYTHTHTNPRINDARTQSLELPSLSRFGHVKKYQTHTHINSTHCGKVAPNTKPYTLYTHTELYKSLSVFLFILFRSRNIYLYGEKHFPKGEQKFTFSTHKLRIYDERRDDLTALATDCIS